MRSSISWRMPALGVLLTIAPAAHAQAPGAPTITWPPSGATITSNRPVITWTGSSHDMYEVHIGSYNSPQSANGWNSGQVSSTEDEAYSGVLGTLQTYWVFVRLRNGSGWGPWSAIDHKFYVDGQLLNDPYLVAASGGQTWQHTMCYNATRNEYLVAYMSFPAGSRRVIEYYRLDSTGTKIGSPVVVIDNLEGSNGPSVCYNSARQEYLIVYEGYTSAGGLHSEMRLQRVNAVTGALIGGSVWLRSSAVGLFPRINYSPTSDCYLLAFESNTDTPWPLYGWRFDSTANPIGSAFHISNGTQTYGGDAAVCYNSVNNEFLVSFSTYTEADPGSAWNLFAQRVRASDGALIGGNITVGFTWESESNSNIAYDSNLNRYLLVYEGGTASPWGQFISNTGTLIGSRFDIATGAFKGGMSNVAWNSTTREWLVTWASCCSANNYGRRLTQTGSFIGEPFQTNGNVAGLGNWDPLPVYNSTNDEYLLNWFSGYASIYVRRYKALTPFAGYPTSYVSIDLGTTNVENGMTHPIGGDGDTIATTIGGRNCHRNMDPSFNDWYMYFTVSDSFIYQGNNQTVDVVFDYYDTGTGSLQINYDAVSTPWATGTAIPLTNTNSWKTGKFRLTDAYFGNRENNGADFRITAGVGPYFYIDTVRVTNSSPVTTLSANPTNGPPALSVNFTATASDADSASIGYEWDYGDGTGFFGGLTGAHNYPNVGTRTASFTAVDDSGLRDTKSVVIVCELRDISVDLGTSDVEYYLSNVVGGDGDTVGDTIGGRECRRNMDAGFNDHYFYFNVSASYAFTGSHTNNWITIDYYDNASTGSLQLQYDATDGNAYKSGGSVAFSGTNTWKQYTFHVTDAYFGNRQNNGTDFRIFGGPTTRYLDVVRVRKDQPAVPPGQAAAPSPANGATSINTGVQLSWTAGEGATSRDVYFGTSNPPALIQNQTATTYNPGTLNNLTTYYWRVNEKNANGTTTGPVWSFTTEAGTLVQLSNSTFASSADGWTISVWHAGTLADGTMAFDNSAGNPAGSMKSMGAGITSNNDSCTREGGEIKKAISTAGYGSIQVSYNLRYATDQTGTTTTGSCTANLVEGNGADKIAVYYSTAGTNGPWTLLEQVTAASVTQNTWHNRSMNLPAGAGNQANFALRFKTQFNKDTDAAWLDNILVSGTTSPPPGQASNPAPANAANGISINSDVSWTAGSSATSHDVRFGTANPPPFVVNQTATTYDPGTLAAGTTYYWRIDEKNGAGTTTGVVWSFTTLAVPGTASAPNPANSATNVSINASPSWTAGSNATSHNINFGTDNPPPFVVNQAAASYEPGALTAGTTYYWRIDEVNESGTTNGTVWSFTTLPLPGAASAPNPANGATGVNVNADLSWTAGSNTVSHDLRFGTTDPPPFVVNQTGASYDPGAMAAGTTYYWRIDEVNGSGTTNGTVWSFTTLPLPAPAGGPNPVNAATNINVNADLSWTAGSGATSHVVNFGTTNPPPAIGGQASTTYDPGTMSAGTTYYWRIDEVNSSGSMTGTVWSFTTLPLPGVASGPGPANGATGVSRNADLSWTAGSNAASHDVRFGTTNPPPFVLNQAGTTYDPGTMAAGTTYYWRIDEVNASGTTTGTVWSFITLPLPGLASGPSPANGATGQNVNVDLAWTAGSNATSHDVRFGTSNPPPFVQNQAGTAFDPGSLNNSTTYYWRIDEVNDSGTTVGTVWSLTTAGTPPSAPTVTGPANGSTVTSLTPTITWTGAAHDGYQVRLSQQDDSNTSTNGWDSGDVTSTGNSAVCGTLRNYSFYYVFVRLRNSGGWGGWSNGGYNFIVNTNTVNGTVYLGNALPSASGWQVYDGTCENGCSGITSTIVADGGSNVWKLVDSHTSNRSKLKYTNGMNIDFTTGASLASRVRATGIGGTPTYNLGISNGNVGGMFLRLYTNEVRLVDINGTNGGSYALDATVYHKYQLTVKNATAGNNSTAAWKVYVDGTLRISWTGAGTDNGFDGLMSGHAGTAATGTWWFDNIAGRSDGEFTPAQWDPVY